ncbi:hypothetical protein ACJX0J_018578, partial [Zea mays]
DLTQLFSSELHGNVIGVVETCLESFHRYSKYLNFLHPTISSKIDPHTCGWRKANTTSLYHYWQEQNSDLLLWRTGILPVGLLTFYGLMEPLDRRWRVLGM